jgi:type IV fimbrial biogenesis protein FimT
VLKLRHPQRGFNLIEVLTTITVLGVLTALAAPSFFEFMQNAQIRTAADAMQNGLQAARGAAIARNLPVQVTVGPGSGWTVAEAASGTVIETRVHEEATPNVTITATPAGAIKLTFSPLGAVTPNTDGTASVTQMDFVNASGGACQTASGPMRCLRVLVSGGGSVRMCDPKFDPAATPRDARACP